MNLKIACSCGKLSGALKDLKMMYGNHFICMCDDCQAFAYYLGHAKNILDVNGGTDIAPVHPANFKIISGAEYLKCVRLSEKGLYRWYVSCCNSPIANSMSGKFGYIGLIASLISPQDRDQVLGPVAARLMARYGIPPVPQDAYQGMTPKIIFVSIKLILRMMIKGLKRPSPFFNPQTDQPVVRPEVISLAERNKLRTLVNQKQLV